MGIRGNRVLDTQYTPSGTEKLFISIGGTSCAIISRDTGFLDLLRARYQWFESSGPAAYEILVRIVPFEELAWEDIGQPGYPLVQKVSSGDNYIIKQADNPFFAVVNTSSRKVLVKMWNSPYCFDSFLCMLFTLLLTGERGLLLHASVISENGQARIFFSPPDSGKMTTALLSAGLTILTDELVIIKPHNDRYRVYGTPFGSEMTLSRSNTRAELTGLYSLKEDQKNNLVPMDKEQAVKELYQCVPVFNDDGHLLSRIRYICRTLVNTVPAYELHFLPGSSFWQVLNEQGSARDETIHPDARLKQSTQ